jgi:hypothetical protein
MAHAAPNGQEPFWTNGGLWEDKEDRALGFANWTHWYLGDPIDQAIGRPSADAGTARLSVQEQRAQIMATQPQWFTEDWNVDAHECPQHDESRWEQFNPKFQRRLASLLAEARKVEERYARELG